MAYLWFCIIWTTEIVFTIHYSYHCCWLESIVSIHNLDATSKWTLDDTRNPRHGGISIHNLRQIVYRRAMVPMVLDESDETSVYYGYLQSLHDHTTLGAILIVQLLSENGKYIISIWCILYKNDENFRIQYTEPQTFISRIKTTQKQNTQLNPNIDSE
jgi:hypothetical protein